MTYFENISHVQEECRQTVVIGSWFANPEDPISTVKKIDAPLQVTGEVTNISYFKFYGICVFLVCVS